MTKAILCSIPECSKPSLKRGWCNSHYKRWTRHGDPLGGGTANGKPKEFLLNLMDLNTDECIKWPFAKDRNGYGTITLDGVKQSVSRFVCAALTGLPPTNKHQAAHICGKGHLGCVNPKHILWKTCADNHADKLIHGTHSRGEKHGASKLTETSVLEIRRLRGRVTQRDLAKRFSVSEATIYGVQTRKKWKWLE